MNAPMKGLQKEHLGEFMKRYGAKDPKLHKELRAKIDKLNLEDTAAAYAGGLGMVPERLLLPDTGEISASGRRVAETIVRANARPVLIIRDNRATTDFLGPDSQVWADRVQAAQAVLDRVIPSVGRVEVGNNPDYTWLGTGWLVADDIMVTNRHVAREFGRQGPAGFVFRVGTNGGPMTSRIDFLEEDHRAASLEYAIESILWIAAPSDPDVAFLRLGRPTGGRALPPPLRFADAAAEDDFVATIGYPARDPRLPDQALVRKVFGEVYDKKRLAPGQIMTVGPLELEHDCSTLGGNSGSVIIHLATGEAVGLHFAGVFMEANYAVPAPKVRELLQRVQQGELPGAATVNTGAAPAGGVPAAPPAPPSGAPATFTYQMQIPIEITVRIGGNAAAIAAPVASGTGAAIVAPPPSAPGDAMASALDAARRALAGRPEVIEARAGYRFKRGWITDERVIVVEVREKLSHAELQAAGVAMIPAQFQGVGVDVRTAALPDQLEHLHLDVSMLEAVRRPGLYREPPDLSLDPVRARMQAIFHASPDSGFPNLKAFLGRVKRTLTATMYEWEPNHISDAIEQAIDNAAGGSLKMVTQRAGTKEAVDDMSRRIGDKFQHVWASVGAGGLITSAYHIKVASRDGEEFWLSSGNWKDSNQAAIDPAGDHSTSIAPLREHNREWHAIIANPTLATMFQKYIEFDFEEAERVPVVEIVPPAYPDLFVPEAAFMEVIERAPAIHYVEPLRLDRE